MHIAFHSSKCEIFVLQSHDTIAKVQKIQVLNLYDTCNSLFTIL
jgi:hypothetical protein